MKKTFLFTLGLVMILSACSGITSNDSHQTSYPSETSQSTSEAITSQLETSNPTTSSPLTSEPFSSTNESSIPSTSHINDQIDYPSVNPFIDETYTSSHAYQANSYNIPEVVPTTDPYASIDTKSERDEFHQNNYLRATSYADAMYRTKHYLISGDVKDTLSQSSFPINHFPNRQYRDLAKYRIDEGVYEYDKAGEFLSYTINNLKGLTKKVYFRAAYVTLEDVAAYVFAFGNVPSNWSSSRSGSLGSWGVYKRFNNSYFSADTDQYKFEPDVPRTDFNGSYSGEGIYKYYEMDFGYTQTDWELGYTTYTEPYNNGSFVTRGPVRLVYTGSDTNDNRGAKFIPMEHRHVFLTYNHYNDFIEYLNYENGWGIPFGWMSAGNEYCSGMSSGSSYGKGYYEFQTFTPKTAYEDNNVYRISRSVGIELLNSLSA